MTKIAASIKFHGTRATLIYRLWNKFKTPGKGPDPYLTKLTYFPCPEPILYLEFPKIGNIYCLLICLIKVGDVADCVLLLTNEKVFVGLYFTILKLIIGFISPFHKVFFASGYTNS